MNTLKKDPSLEEGRSKGKATTQNIKYGRYMIIAAKFTYGRSAAEGQATSY